MTSQRYRVIERLEAGGMAEVFLGEAVSVQGFKKRVAIKRVLPHLAQNRNFIAMFLDEARLGARLNHTNIVTVFDIGAADNTYFLVMEYVDGSNLKALIEALRNQGRIFPLKEGVYIAMEACRGLSYAHELTDENGTHLDIVHRDVSPPNIMISKRGEVKMTDFGLAKATTQLEKTDPGVVKGKFSYLSPEAALGHAVDHRADIFALGVVLWEMLAGRRMFLGETDYQTVKLVQQANIPSLQRLNPEVDDEFEQILGRSLARDRDQRFQSAREFGDALAGYLFSKQMKVTSYDLANMLKVTFAQERRPRPSYDQSIIDRLIQEELLRFTSLDEISETEAAQSTSSPRVPSVAPSRDHSEGSMPLDAGSFENPADWFRNDEDVAAAIGDHKPNANVAPAPSWHESAVDVPTTGTRADADLDAFLAEKTTLSSRPPRPHLQPVPSSFPPLTARSSAPARPIASSSSRPPRPSIHPPDASSFPPPKGPKHVTALLVGVVVVLLGVGAAAWFGGVIR